MILFQGSGPTGEPQTIQRLTADGPQPLAIDGCPRPGYPATDRAGKFLAFVSLDAGTAALHTGFLLPGKAGLKPEPPAATAKAFYYPRISPSGRRLAVIETPGQGFPARRGAVGRLAVFARAGLGWLREPFDRPISVEAFDWGTDEETLIAVEPAGDLALLRLDRPDRSVPLSAGGRLPTVSPDGQRIAYIDDGALTLLDDAGPRPLPLPGPVTAACWALDGSSLLAAVSTGFWQASLLRLPLDGGEPAELHRTSAIGWIAETRDA